MKKLTHLLTAVLLTSSLVLSGCSDDKKDDPKPTPVVPQPTKKEILTAKTWKITKILVDGIDVTNHPDMADMKNQREKFNKDGTYMVTFAGSSQNGIWEFRNNETVLVYDQQSADEQAYNIVELKENSLKTRATIIENGQTFLLEVEEIYAE